MHYDVFKDVHTNVIAQTYMFYMYVGISGGGGALNAKEITFLHDAYVCMYMRMSMFDS